MHLIRPTTGAIAVAIAMACSVPAPTAGAAPPVARTARACSLPRYPGLGYFTSLYVTDTSCSEGDRLVFAYYRCRLQHGKAGSCHESVLGYTCHEKRESIPTEIDARVTCTRGRATIIHSYQQDT